MTSQIYKSQKGAPITYTTIIKISEVKEKEIKGGKRKGIEAKSYPFTDEKEKPQDYSYMKREKDIENKIEWWNNLKVGNIMNVFVVEKTKGDKIFKNIYPALKSFEPLTEEDL